MKTGSEVQSADAGFEKLAANKAKLDRRQKLASMCYAASSALFFLAWLVGLADYVPFLMLRSMALTLSYGLRLLAYVAWKGHVALSFQMEPLVAFLNQNDTQLVNSRAPLPEINKSALQRDKHAVWVGVVACLALLAYYFCPPLAGIGLLVGVWSLALSNSLWARGCQLTTKKSAAALEQSVGMHQIAIRRYQSDLAYAKYASLLTLASLFIAAATTATTVFPLAAGFLGLTLVAGFTLQSVVCAILGASSIHFLFKSYYIAYETTQQQKRLDVSSKVNSATLTQP